METNEGYIIIRCTECGNNIQVKAGTVIIFCVKCRNWMQVKVDPNNEQEKS